MTNWPRILLMQTIFLGAAIMAAACTTSTLFYQAVDGQYGYSEQQIEENRFRVTLKSDSSTSKKAVENHLLFRAAELTIEHGHDYFIVVKQETEETRAYRRVTPLIYGYYPCSFRRFPYYAYGYSWAYETAARDRGRYEAVAFIVMYAGERQEGDPNAFDARELINDIGRFIERPSSGET